MSSLNIDNSINPLLDNSRFIIAESEPYLPLNASQITPSLLPTFNLNFNSLEYLNFEVIPAAQIALQQFAISPKFTEDIQVAFGYGCNLDLAQSLIDRFASGQDLPLIEILAQSQLGANGAFGNDTVFLSADLLVPNNKSVAVNALLEELGHFIDSQINDNDAAGDEGAIFSRLVQGQSFQEDELAMFKAEDDRGVLNIKDANGLSQSIFVEQANWNLDIDGDGKVSALSDGIMAVRYMFGSAFSGNALINGAISPTATRNLAQIQAYLQEGMTQKYLDIDGDGNIGALSDGIMAVRYMFGSAFSGNALTNGAVSPTATRNLASIQTYLAVAIAITPTLPTVTIATSDANATETVIGQLPDSCQFTLTRTGNLAAALTVGYTVSGTAINGIDYTNLSGSVTFAAGAATALVNVSVIDDAIFEGNETVVLTLVSNAAYTLGAATNATVTISDNDLPIVPSMVEVSATDNVAAETTSGQIANLGQFTLTRVGTDSAIAVNYTLSGTAANGTDYLSLNGVANFAVGASTAVVNVTPIDDVLFEGDETVILALAAGSGYTLGALNNSRVTISDNDIDLKKYLFAYNFKNGEYATTDSYYGSVIAGVNKYSVGQVYDFSSSSNETGFNGTYYISSVEEYNDSLTGDLGKVFVSSYTDRDNGVAKDFIPYKYKNGLQPSGTNYLGSEIDWIEDNNSENSKFGSDLYEADPNNILPFITVSSPNGGGNALQRGQTYNILWNDNITEDVRIDLYKGGAFYRRITAATPSTGSFVWNVPADVVTNDPSGVPNYVSIGSDYTIRIQSTTNTSLFDVSDTNFSIAGNPSYDLLGVSFAIAPTSANAGSTIQYGYTIRNNGADPTGLFKVGFYISPDTTFTTSDYLVGEISTSIGANTSRTFDATLNSASFNNYLNLPAAGNSFWSGDKLYYVGAIADSQNVIAESNEGNNSGQASGNDYSSISISGTTLVKRYDFKFSYNNGSGDYYAGFVYGASGTHYTGKTINAGLGQYQILNESNSGTSADLGKVFLNSYYDADSSQAYYVPDAYVQNRSSGTNGLTSESDYVYNSSSVGQGFSAFSEADVPKVTPTVDLQKYWFYYNFNPSNYLTADSYNGYVIAPAGKYAVSPTFETNFDPNPNSITETGYNGAYSVYQVDNYDDNLTADNGKVFVQWYRDRDNGGEKQFTPYKYSQIQASGTNYLGSESDWIENNQSSNSVFGGDNNEADPNQISIPANRWKAEYFNGTNPDSGIAIKVEDAGDGSQNLNLNFDANPPSGVPNDNFSARVTTTRYLEQGIYRITTNSDDGIQVFVGDTGKRVDQWIDKGAGDTYTGYFYVGTGNVPIIVKYYEKGGGASVKVEITKHNNLIQEIVDEKTNWKASVFTLNGENLPDPNFYADPNSRQIATVDLDSATRSDGKKGINFDYGTRAFDENSNLPHDNYAVRAYTQTKFDGGQYKFRVRGDDAFQIFARKWGGGDTYITPSSSSWDQAYGDAKEYIVNLDAGDYDLHFQYVEQTGNAYFDLSWEKVNTLPTFQSPVRVGYSVSQEYGIYNSSAGGYHAGTDIMPLTSSDVSIYSIGKGVVVYTNGSGDVADDTNGNRGFGNTVIVEHTLSDGSKIRSQYSHLKYSSIKVIVGQTIDENTVLGTMGNTGYSFGRHLHLEIEKPDTWSKQGAATIMGVGYPVNHPDTYGFFDPVVFLNL